MVLLLLMGLSRLLGGSVSMEVFVIGLGSRLMLLRWLLCLRRRRLGWRRAILMRRAPRLLVVVLLFSLGLRLILLLIASKTMALKGNLSRTGSTSDKVTMHVSIDRNFDGLLNGELTLMGRSRGLLCITS